MSLILDALNKDGRERNHGAPDINAPHSGARGADFDRRWLWVLSGCVAVLLIVVTVLAIAWLRSPTSVPASEPAGPAPRLASAPAPSALAQVQAPSATAVTPPPTAVNPEVEALYQTQQEVVQIIEPQVRAAATEPAAAPKQTTIDEGLARALWEESRPKPLPQVAGRQVIRPQSPPVEQASEINPAIAADPENGLGAYADIPFLHELPTNVQDTIPTLMYAQHSFDDGTVILNKKRYGAGDVVDADLVVEQVLADGLLLSFAGRQFKLAALSSWVNR